MQPNVSVGERLTDGDVDTILKLTGTEEDLDGNVKYEGNTVKTVQHSGVSSPEPSTVQRSRLHTCARHNCSFLFKGTAALYFNQTS